MNKITAITFFQAAAGYRLSMAYSEINDEGLIIKDNARADRILVDPDALRSAEALMQYAQGCIDKEG